MIERVDLGLVEEDAGLLVGDDRAVVPGVPQAAHHIDELAGDLVAQVVLGDSLAWLKLSAAVSCELVTMFQAARPPLIWCSVAKVRATLKGSLKLVETVPPSPM